MTPEEAQDAAPAPHSGLSVHPSAYAQNPLDDYDPSEPGDPWSEYLDQPEVLDACIPHLHRCLALDPARHDHRP